MRIIDLHCYPGTAEWIACQGPYVAELARYWKREGVGKPEEEVIKDFADAGVDACLVALDLEMTIKTRPVGNDYVRAMWQRHPQRILQCWGALEPEKKDVHEQATKYMRKKFAENSSEEMRKQLTNEELNFTAHFVLLVQSNDLEKAV